MEVTATYIITSKNPILMSVPVILLPKKELLEEEDKDGDYY